MSEETKNASLVNIVLTVDELLALADALVMLVKPVEDTHLRNAAYRVVSVALPYAEENAAVTAAEPIPVVH